MRITALAARRLAVATNIFMVSARQSVFKVFAGAYYPGSVFYYQSIQTALQTVETGGSGSSWQVYNNINDDPTLATSATAKILACPFAVSRLDVDALCSTFFALPICCQSV